RDPHIWLSPKRVSVMIEAIRDKMCEINPENAEIYTSNAKAYIDKLKAVDDEIKLVLSSVQNKKMIVFHPAFGYIGEDYEITMYSLEEEGKEATATHLAEMIDLAKRENIKVIFYQEEIDSSQSKAFAEEIGGKTVMLSPLAPNYIENMRLMAKTISEAMN
ncbi:MAG: zinc ABC transporter substrate-binding protein, partial [Oscillospiraceae bacterium]|nr:zinc ABC transporter substrate-binding protein [Oscillospiraceae bacterium]